MQPRGIRRRDVAGEPVAAHGVTVTPHARLLRIDLPFGAFVWQRPSHLLVERAGRVERHAIVDVTRRVQLGLLALSVVVIVASRVAARGHRGRSGG